MYNKLSNGDINYAVLILNYTICGISGFSIVLSNSFFGFAYLRDKLHLYLEILLPIVGYSITLIIFAISTNEFDPSAYCKKLRIFFLNLFDFSLPPARLLI